MSEKVPAPLSVIVLLPVEGSPISATHSGVEFTVVDVEWRAHRGESGVYSYAAAFGKDGDNQTRSSDLGPTLPPWAPTAPPWFEQVVAEMRDEVSR